LSWELERPYSAPALRRTGACLPITGDPGKWLAAREGVGGGRSSDDGQDNTTCPERRAPHQRVAILASRKHGLAGFNWSDRFTWDWLGNLGIYRLTGTVRYPAAHA
jgi:hypothetical protein